MNERIILDGNRMEGSGQDASKIFFEELRRQLGEDLLIGSNLDALHDALTSITSYTVVEVCSEELLTEALGDYWKKVLWVINDCLDENENLALEMADR